jgi:hypothetical protein
MMDCPSLGRHIGASSTFILRQMSDCVLCPMVIDMDMAGAGFVDVGSEAWTFDGQTNGINFIQFVCPSPWLLDGSGCWRCRR